MKLLVDFLRSLFGPSFSTLVENLHIRLLNDWLVERGVSFVHPRCLWKVANGHPCEGVFVGQDFYSQYIREINNTYSDWHEIVNDIIGSRIGGIVVGEYQFRCKENDFWYTAPFTHFYRIHQGKIVGVRYCMGEVSIRLHCSQEHMNVSTLFAFHSLN
ncbi:nuclear transport factor 2 family protein [Spirosoma spitsbergense]|uniref:nuclear transport factor 2 family protein n=1 Tax=Spirosoma spitsbergense TaxID=431554 RepID=UPI00036B2FCD|nr:nuclear transport factor 2 family protein [Spirosoma spitsbergense]